MRAEREACLRAGGWGMDVRTQARSGQEARADPAWEFLILQALAPLGCAVSQVVKTAQSRGRTERTLLFVGALAGRSTASPTARRGRRNRRNAADRLDPSLLISHYCLLHPTHHADKR